MSLLDFWTLVDCRTLNIDILSHYISDIQNVFANIFLELKITKRKFLSVTNTV